MELQFHRPGDHLYVHSVNGSSIRVVDTEYRGALILSSEEIIDGWPVASLAELTVADLEPLFALEPEIAILGPGDRQQFLPPELLMEFYRRGIGVEAMNTAAAARTFNVLVSEERNVAAALLPGSD